MNAPSAATLPSSARSRFFTVRFFKGCFRFLFSRRMVWLGAILISLAVLLYQYENWNGARELRDARARMIARAGTEDYRTLLPPVVPEEDNFFAIPVIKSWRVPTDNKDVAGGYTHQFPGADMLPDKYDAPRMKETPGRWVLNLAAWEQKRAKSGKPVPAGKTAVSVISDEIGDSRGVLPQLIAGLDRRASQVIPSRRSCLEAANGNLLRCGIPSFSNLFSTQLALALHLRAAALTGDAGKTRDVAGVMLRLGDAFNDPLIVSNLCSMAVHNVTLEALNEALACRTLTDGDLEKITAWLTTTNDVAQVESMFRHSMLTMDSGFEMLKADHIDRKRTIDSWLTGSRVSKGFGEWQFVTALTFGPSGWLDTNHAGFLENALLHCGETGEEGWRSAKAGIEKVGRHLGRSTVLFAKGNFAILNPRRILGAMATPPLSNLWGSAVQNLFHRRCALLTCALRRHQLAHGAFPATLAGLDAALLPSPQTDPAKAGAPMGYQLTEKGFLLWSAGDDRNDDGGHADKDWLWYHDVN